MAFSFGPSGDKPTGDDSLWRLLAKLLNRFYSSNSVSRVDVATTALDANANRKAAFIQNLGTNKLYVKKGAACSTADFSGIIVGGSAQDDGTGGVFSIGTYTGIVTIAGTSPRYVVCEDS